jgi:hypothetical protein
MESHDLHHEFPTKIEKIHELKISNHHFRHLFEEYDKVEHEIHRIETGAEITADHVLNELRMKRVHLKDQIAELLN